MSSTPYTALLIISILVAGYILATFCYRFKYVTAREAGHRLYLTSATLGITVALVIEAIIYFVDFLCGLLKHLPWVSGEINVFSDHHSLILIAALPIASIIFTYIYNKNSGSKSKNIKRAWEKDDLSALIQIATQELKPLAVTMDSRKVYIGLVARTNEPDQSRSHITILPYYSGYRDEATLHLHITNKYFSVFDYYSGNESENLNIEDLYIVIPTNRIMSVHIFNDRIYEAVNKQKTTQLATEK